MKFVKAVHAVHMFFFGSKKIPKSDAVWFYGFFFFIVAMLIFLAVINIQLINM